MKGYLLSIFQSECEEVQVNSEDSNIASYFEITTACQCNGAPTI